MECSDFSTARRCACGNVRRTTRALTQFYDDYMKPSGLRSNQFSILLNVHLNAGITVGGLAELLLMDQTTVTRNMAVLLKAGYIKMEKAGGDARKREFYISPAGLEKLKEAMPLWEMAQAHIVEKLGGDRFRDFLKTLSEISFITKGGK